MVQTNTQHEQSKYVKCLSDPPDCVGRATESPNCVGAAGVAPLQTPINSGHCPLPCTIAIYRDSTRTIAITIIDFLLSNVVCAHAHKILPCELDSVSNVLKRIMAEE